MNYEGMLNLNQMLKEAEELNENNKTTFHQSTPVETAPPISKIKATINNRDYSTHPSCPENEIWRPDEIKNIKYIEDERETPDYDVVYKQNLKTEDVYLGMTDMDPSSNKCQYMVLKVKLPNTDLKTIVMDMDEEQVWIQTPYYNLNYFLPYKVKKESVKSEWSAKKSELSVSMEIIRSGLW